MDTWGAAIDSGSAGSPRPRAWGTGAGTRRPASASGPWRARTGSRGSGSASRAGSARTRSWGAGSARTGLRGHPHPNPHTAADALGLTARTAGVVVVENEWRTVSDSSLIS